MHDEGACAEKTRLLFQYDRWMDEYLRRAVGIRSRLSRLKVSAKAHERRAFETARAKLERARLDLYWHVARHGC